MFSMKFDAAASLHIGRELYLYALSAHVVLDEDQDQAERWVGELEKQGDTDRIAGLSVKGTALGLVGTPEVIASRIKEYQDIGVNMVMLNFCQGIESMKRFAKDVIPLVND